MLITSEPREPSLCFHPHLHLDLDCGEGGDMCLRAETIFLLKRILCGPHIPLLLWSSLTLVLMGLWGM